MARSAKSLGDARFLGRWLGTIGPRERVPAGFELRRGDDGTLELSLTSPMINVYGMHAPGTTTISGDELRNDDVFLALTLRGARLEGTYPGPQSPATFRRASRLPSERPLPRVPSLPDPRWETRVGGQVFASPVTDGSRVFIGTTGGVMNALAADSGAVLWAFGVGRPILGAALLDEGTVTFSADDGRLHRLAAEDGREIWRYELGDARVPRLLPHGYVFDFGPDGVLWDHDGPRPVSADGTLFIGAADGGFHAVDAVTGGRRWRRSLGARIRGSAVVSGQNVIVGTGAGRLVALDRATGRRAWTADTGAPITSAPTVAGDVVLIGNRGRGVLGFDVRTGRQLWRTTFWGSWVESTGVLADGTVYIGASDLRRITALDPADGHVIWRTDVFGWSWGTPLVEADRIVVGTAGGRPYFCRHVAGLCVLDRATGRLVARRPLPEVPGAHQWGVARSIVRAADLVVAATIEGGVFGYPIP